jgi:CubicO group peptidase (beta-lactamase class C family)
VVVVGLNEPLPGKTYAGSIYEYLATLSKDPNYEHGEIFKYQTPKVDVVNWAVNRVTGMSFGEYMYEELWSLLGTDSEAYILLDRNGTLFAGGGLSAPPNDLARFAAMLANNGAFNGQQIVSPSIIKQLKAGGSTEKFANPSSVLQQLAGNVLGANEWSYRAYWWIRHTPGKEAFMASGIHGQWIYVDVDRNIAIVKQSSQPDSETEYSIAYDIFGFDAIVSHLRK